MLNIFWKSPWFRMKMTRTFYRMQNGLIDIKLRVTLMDNIAVTVLGILQELPELGQNPTLSKIIC